ncbi:hypothetical protein HG430_002495 [Candidatus Gracilibacteria bacterium]|nr:hypothetical protein [Candidatus Gracilibacteria bacterium]
MKKEKIISTVIFVVIFVLFAIFFSKGYLDFQENLFKKSEQEQLVLKEAEEFNVSKIENLENADLKIAPDEKILSNFVEKLDKAEKNIYIEVYMLTEKRITESLKKARNRGVDVKVLLEKSPYKTENINNKVFEELKDAGVNVTWSNEKNYYLNHSKFFVIDDLLIASTGNLTYSTFTVNRDFFFYSSDTKLLQTVKNIFENDFKGKKVDFYHNNLIMSPNYSRVKLEKYLQSATKNIKIYIQYLKDEKINNSLLALKKEKNIDIEIIIDKKNLEDESVEILKNAGIKIKGFDGKTMHSKAILIDEKYLFIGSINFSEFSIDKNREFGVFLKEENLIKNFLEIFEKDFGN